MTDLDTNGGLPHQSPERKRDHDPMTTIKEEAIARRRRNSLVLSTMVGRVDGDDGPIHARELLVVTLCISLSALLLFSFFAVLPHEPHG